MTATNDITGDAIKTRISEGKKKFDKNIALIKPSCYTNCSTLVGTLSKCRMCDWNPNNAPVQK